MMTDTAGNTTTRITKPTKTTTAVSLRGNVKTRLQLYWHKYISLKMPPKAKA